MQALTAKLLTDLDTRISGLITGVSSIVAGTGITLSPSSGLGDVTINAAGSGGGGVVSHTYAELAALKTGSTLFPDNYTK